MEVIRRVYREDHEQFRASVRRFIERECAPRQQAWNKEGEVDRETWLKAGREGMLCTTLPAEYGGGGGDFGHAAILAEELAYGGVSGLSIGLHSDIIAPYINRLGTEEQKMRWLPKVCAGEIILAIAMTEPGGGSDLKSVRTTAVREGDEYVINGSKTFISNGIVSDMVLVVCKTDPAAGAKGVSLIMVETNREGFRRGRKLEKVGMHAQDTAELFFDNVRVPVDNRLGEENKGFMYMMQDLAQERFMIAVNAAAKVERLLEQTLEYVKDRKAFGQTVWDFQNTRFKLADIKTQAVALRTMVDYYISEHIRRKLTAEEAAVAKLYASETMWKCIDDMVQLHGGYGYMLEYPIARAFVDMRVSRIYGGTNEVMRELISRKL
ncbi:Acyl-CoA dehydrogenase [Paraburkholderia domus]|uniref:acyl-CoA dehydrogenase family protein n=1 Tax=Paraburkholderia domus TaxID=2793075 RepID=UPI001912B4EC|nr:acyl-CoA dehydrogenase family protein [Paraburkholderia domus]MBK5050527.1 acyl-CoA dehydrogenase family protein [Burkholderia sp. R-70006]CAE6753083.1 Acyl-CoA dehydrogenase [Paraburkholderia domus]